LAPVRPDGWAVTFDVMAGCPQPLPVQFKISYAQAGRLVTAELPGFPDLAQPPLFSADGLLGGMVGRQWL
jgi:hypothetical protein